MQLPPTARPAVSLLLASLALAGLSFGASSDGDQGENHSPELSVEDWSALCQLHQASLHAIERRGGELVSRNPGRGWTTRYDDRGATTVPDDAGWRWGLELSEWGFDGALIETDRAMGVGADGNRAELRWSEQLTEWWVNEPGGLEHGFTVFAPPARSACADAPLCFALDVRGELRPLITQSRRSARFVDSSGVAVLEYAGLLAFDANGAALRAWMEIRGEQLTICVDDSCAVYPITVDPVLQYAYLKASNTDWYDEFGYSVAIWGDTVAVGAVKEDSSSTTINGDQHADDHVNDNYGAVYVFVREADTWRQQAYVKPPRAGRNYRFGTSVALSEDTLVVGEPNENRGFTGVNPPIIPGIFEHESGAAYVFTRNGITWSEQAYIKASNTDEDDGFGTSVAISGDTLVIGAPDEESGIPGVQSDNTTRRAGAAYVFTRTGTTWTQEAYLKAPDPDIDDDFGASVAVSGGLIAVAAHRDDSGGVGVNSGLEADNSLWRSGAVHVFRRSGSAWVADAFLKASNPGTEDGFGHSLAILNNTLVVGSFGEDSSATGVNSPGQADNSADSSGAAYVFFRSNGAWQQEAYLKASNTDAGDFFGLSVAVATNAVLVGAPFEGGRASLLNYGSQTDNSLQNSGAAYLFRREGGHWSQHAYVKASTPDSSDWFGNAVGIHGEFMVVGARFESSRGTDVNSDLESDNSAVWSGAAYIYPARPIGLNYCSPVPHSGGQTARMVGMGTSEVTPNDVTLGAIRLPPHVFGLFAASPERGLVTNPGGSHGNLCLGGAIGRFIGPGQIVDSGPSGAYSITLDLTRHPTPTGFVNVQPGETWHFVTWFRDVVAGQATSNYSNGLTVHFR